MDDGRNPRILNNVSRRLALNELAQQVINDWTAAGLFRSCINCDNWDQRNEICSKFKERPPAKVIVTGCDHHLDEIPY